jgi:hypothetical protein
MQDSLPRRLKKLFLLKDFSKKHSLLTKLGEALSSRYLFDNWMSLLVKYILSKMGFKTRLYAKINGCISKDSSDIFSRLLSWSWRGMIKSTKCLNGKILLNDVAVDDLNNIISDPIKLSQAFSWRYDETYNCWIKQGIRFRNMRESCGA